MNKLYAVYKHTVPDGRVYIGMTSTGLERRSGKDGNRYARHPRFSAAISEYGWDAISHEIIADNLTREEAIKREKEEINNYDATNSDKGFNMLSGVGGINGGCFVKGNIPWNKGRSWQTREQISKRIAIVSQKNTGKHHSSEWNKHISDSHAKKPVIMCEYDGTEIIVFTSCKEASVVTGINYQKICAAASGKRKSSGGFKWSYLIEEGE